MPADHRAGHRHADATVRHPLPTATGWSREEGLAVFNRIRHELRARFIRVVEEVVVREVDRTIKAVHDVEFRSRRDLHAAGERDAVAASERFAREVMPTATTFTHPRPTLEHALALAPTEGMALEFGVFSGGTLRMISEARRGSQVYGFDSLKGLPEDWRPNIPARTFETDRIPQVPGAELVVGWFEDTLPEFLAEHPGQVAFLHIDCDLYSSTKTVLDHVGPRLAPGAVIVFDEYFNYPGWEQHEHRAWQEYVARTGVRFHYEAYTSNNEQVVIRLSGARADQGETPSC